jgi:hypothetical protein
MLDRDHQIIVYPSRVKFAKYLLLFLLALAGFTLVTANAAHYVVRGPLPAAIVSGSILLLAIPCALILSVVTLSTAFRLFVRVPSVILSDEGITDRCSLIAGGCGLLRWDEIRSVSPYQYSRSTAFLLIHSRNPFSVMARYGPLRRLFAHSITLTLGTRIALPEWLLSMRVSALATLIGERSPRARA